MTDAAVEQHKARLIKSLKRIYRTGTITRPLAASRKSNGRGGFTTTPAPPEDIWIQRETDTRQLTYRNVAPDQALIFVLNTTTAPVEGDVLSCATLGDFQVKDVDHDPVTAVYHCKCDHV